MASCAIPVLFPAQKIHGINNSQTHIPNGHYSDGGTGGTFKNFKDKLREIGVFEKLFIVSPMREVDEIEDLRIYLEELLIEPNENSIKSDIKKILEKELEKIFGHVSMKKFIEFLINLKKENEENKIAEHIFVSMPNLVKNCGILEFPDQKGKYDEVQKWAKNNPDACMTIDDFIKEPYKGIIIQ